MSKVANRYLRVDPWKIIEDGFHPERAAVSESIFSVGNEFMGVRGYFEEGYSGAGLLGSFFNGIFEYEDIVPKPWPKGPIGRQHFMVNAVDWLYTRLRLDGETLDLHTANVTEFTRELDLRTGVYTRRFVWRTSSGKRLRVSFERFTSMADAQQAAQRIVLEALDSRVTVKVTLALDFTIQHKMAGRNMWPDVRTGTEGGLYAALGRLPVSGHSVFASMRLAGSCPLKPRPFRGDKLIGAALTLSLTPGVPVRLERMVVNLTERNPQAQRQAVWRAGLNAAKRRQGADYESALAESVKYWTKIWDNLGVTIEGDTGSEQGVRFGIFQLHQTYHGVDPRLNVAAKGLTGENYLGHTWWDTETYCLPFYLFNNPHAARNLLGYRYRTLPKAVERSASDDARGARYPMSSIDGYESCGWWAHGDLEIHVSAAVGYGIWHYVNVTGDREFLYTEGIEMLLQICRFYAARGGFGQATGEFGLYGVMGPDEFHMMVNNNCYTNVLAKKCFEWTLTALAEMKARAPRRLAAVRRRVKLDPDEPRQWARMARRMRVPQDRKTGVFEQHDGYFNYPHTDVETIPPTDFPLYAHWSYFRLFRTDMTKQPDVLLMQFLFSHDYSDASKRANYAYYEPRCSHESSLSPSIHSIMAAELGDFTRAWKYWGHAARLDLDDYNRNSHEGLHTTSMAAAWLNIVYGFGGMRSDGKTLSFKPALPRQWQGFSFRIFYRGSVLKVHVNAKRAQFSVVTGQSVTVTVFGRRTNVGTQAVEIPMPRHRCG